LLTLEARYKRSIIQSRIQEYFITAIQNE